MHRRVAAVLLLTVAGCAGESELPAAATEEAPAQELAGADAPSVIVASPEHGRERIRALAGQHKGDLDEIVERGVVRILVIPSQTFYFLDGARQRGVSYEAGQLFLDWLSENVDTDGHKLRALYVPTTQERILDDLLDGYGDIAAAALTITPARRERVAFSDPFATGLTELLVTGPAAPAVGTLRDLAGATVCVRPGSNQAQSLEALSDSFVAEGLPAIDIELMDPLLEDADILEMVAAGVLPMTVGDEYTAQLWGDVLPGVEYRDDLPIGTDRSIAWAVRPGTAKLLAAVNGFVAGHRRGTLMGNILMKRYLGDNDWVRNNVSARSRERLSPLRPIFTRWGEEYDFDWLLLAAQGYQESGLDQTARSRAGAVGIMQLLPATAADPNVGIPDISTREANIQAGAKYLRFIIDRYFDEPGIAPIDRRLFALAAYNAGPRRIVELRRRAAAAGIDPDVWFRQVELLAARHVSREPVEYVRNIYQYYLAYRALFEQETERRARSSQ